MNQMCRCYAWDLNCKQEVRTSSYENFPDLKESKKLLYNDIMTKQEFYNS